MSEIRKNIEGFGSIFKKKITRSNGETYISPYWSVLFYHNGKEYRKSSNETDDKKAIRYLKEEIKSLGRGVVRATESKVKFEDLMAILEGDYATHKKVASKNLPSYKKHLSEFFAGWKAMEIESDSIDKFIKKRRSEAATDSTINRELAALNRGFSLAVRAGKIHHKPHIPKLREDNTRKGFVEPADFNRLLAELPEHIRDLVEFLYLSCWRREKAQTLTWSHVFENEIRLDDTGTNKNVARQLPLTGRLKGLIERRKNARRLDCHYVFHHNGRPMGDFRKTWWSACVSAGLGRFEQIGEGKNAKKIYHGLIVHDLRRSGIRDLVRSDVREGVVMAISGHKTRSVFDRYNIVDDTDIKKAFNAVDNYREQSTESRVAPIKKAEGK